MSILCVTIFEQLKKDKVNLENTLEQEQELLVNRLWKRMDRLEAEKRYCEELGVIMVRREGGLTC